MRGHRDRKGKKKYGIQDMWRKILMDYGR